jgi:uncharacterized C2H2 Zn-finger protein
MLYGKQSCFSKIHTKHVNKAELYYRLSPNRAVNTLRLGFKNQAVNAVWETMAVCSEIHTKRVNKAESYFRLRSHRAGNTVVCIYVS